MHRFKDGAKYLFQGNRPALFSIRGRHGSWKGLNSSLGPGQDLELKLRQVNLEEGLADETFDSSFPARILIQRLQL